MSGDLISRDKLLEDFRNTITEKSDTLDWLNMIARQPIFNVGYLIERIDNEVLNLTNIQLDKIIEILKGGGLNG